VNIIAVKRVIDIDCNLCGECVRECRNDALKVGICNTRPGQNRIRGVWFAPLITLVLICIAVWLLAR
jgi:ferredoxin